MCECSQQHILPQVSSPIPANPFRSELTVRSIVSDDEFEDQSLHVPASLNDDGSVKKPASELAIKLFKQGAS